jgi:DNA topoisomerase-1
MAPSRHVVIVESPAKAKTINRYLGDDYEVLASYGHVRDLEAKDGSVRPESDFDMSWTVDGRGAAQLKKIAQAVKDADELILATDPDREGEAISWHIVDELARRRVLKDVPVKRVVFNEVTKQAVREAFQRPRPLNQELIDAYLARRALDYLVGFTLSPVLWRKLPGSRSAGRVQSVALRLICEREADIEVFRPQEYWSIQVKLRSSKDEAFTARLAELNGTKLERLSIGNKGAADDAKAVLEQAGLFSVESIERKEVRRNPQPPFTTSTLQQEASRKLGFGAARTMSLAQRLYEGVDIGGETVGLITYMRTDGVQLSQEAITAAREVIGEDQGGRYLPAQPRLYRTKAKNAQEAHEAIRPTDPARRPAQLRPRLDDDAFRLYELIWKRTLASQMESARLDQVSVVVAVANGEAHHEAPRREIPKARLRASGSVVLFDGFLKLYEEGRDDSADEEQRRLPALSEGEACRREAIEAEQHFTQPPPRFTEASLIKRLEELGIGRPSTYTSILQVLQDRNYVRLEKRRFHPEDRGRVVTAFLTSFFKRYVEYDFTARLEEQLDDISGGRVEWRRVLKEFWEAFSKAVEETKDLKIADVIDALDEELGPHFFPRSEEHPEADPRACPACADGRLGLRLGKTGGFIGCSNYPECRYTRPLGVAGAEPGDEGKAALAAGGRDLGYDPASGQRISLRSGPYGPYVQLGEAQNGEKPRRVSLPKSLNPEEVDLDIAVKLLALPRSVGRHPETGEEILAGIGRYGPYVKLGNLFRSLPDTDDVLTIGLNRAVSLLAEAPRKGRAAATPIRTLGEHPSDQKPVELYSGRYGPYIKHDKLIASLPKRESPDSIDLSRALELLNAQAEKKKTKGGKAAGRRPKSRRGANAG